jgi:hypothetical protein
MPELRSPQDLLRVIGDVAATEDPIVELRRRGFTFSADLERRLRDTRPNAIPASTRRRLALLASRTRATVRAGGAPASIATPRFAPDDYDVIAAIRTALADSVLNGLHQTHAIPQQIPLQRLLSAEERTTLATALTGVFPNIPADAAAGTLTIRGPLSTRALNGTTALLLALPFSLDFVRLTPFPTVVGVLSGTLSVIVALDADVQFLGNPEAASIRISARLRPNPPEGAPSLTIDASSPIQPQSPGQLPGLALVLQNVLAGIVSQSFEISPFITIPGVPGLRLIVADIDVRAVTSPDGDRIGVGLRFAGASATPPDLGRLERLQPDGGRNVVLRVQERYFDAVLENARANGTLDRIAREQDDGARIKSADAKFSNNQIILTFKGEVVDACVTLNVDFTVTQTLTLFLEEGQLRVESVSTVDVSDADAILCAIMAFVVGLALSLPTLLTAPLIGVFQAILIAGGLLDFPSGSSSSTLVPLNRPIPRTELLPVLGNLITRLDDGALIASATASFRPDDINTYIYARFLNSMHRFDPGVPLNAARVEVYDQDAPPPPGDDAVRPQEGEIERIVGNRFIRTVTRTFEAPTRDPLLGQSTTDADGRVMIVLTPAQVAHPAGTLVTTTTIEDLRTHEIDSQTTRRPVREGAPDIYFRVFAMGDMADTRSSSGGLTVNLGTKHLGTPAVPLTIAVRLTPGIVLG